MLDFISCQNDAIPQRLSCESEDRSKFNRNQKDDVKQAVEHIFDLQEKLSKLHPNAQAIAVRMLKIGY